MQTQNLTAASRELFRRTPDECFGSLRELAAHCAVKRNESHDRWLAPATCSTAADGQHLVCQTDEGGLYTLNDWSFGQLCRLSGASKETVNRLSTETAALVLQETLPRHQTKPWQLLTRGTSLRSVHGAAYTRLACSRRWMRPVVCETGLSLRVFRVCRKEGSAVSKYRRGVGPEDLEKIVQELIDQLKVLVVAVDDLRCDVEGWSRNGGEAPLQIAAQRPSALQSSELSIALQEAAPELTAMATDCNPLPSSSSAADRLHRLEKSLMSGPQGAWLDPWPGEDAPDLPSGRVIAVDEELWLAVLELRPAHIVGADDDDCEDDCEDDIGAPYLLAWQDDNGCYLRELDDEEALQLQRLCLESRNKDEAPMAAQQPTTQQSLW